jgi:two-component system phosphate regulon sensor histidine kinase PhoR
VLKLVTPKNLDSLLHKYVEFHNLDTIYEFAILKSHNDSIIFETKGFKITAKDKIVFRHCLSCIYDKEHYHVELIFPQLQKYLFLKVWGWLLLSGLFIIVIVFCFGFIVFAVYLQKKVSEMKTDFINNMTHELKTPISTISLASEILVNSNAETSQEKIQQYAKIIYEENERMRSQVDQALRIAQLDKGEFEINKEETDVHELIQAAVNNLYLDHCGKPVEIVYQLNAAKALIMADPLHLSNIIKNLIENACKYSKENLKIEISTFNIDDKIIISVKDNGIGISAEHQKYIFDKFYRVPTGDVHDVKGFGIGLYYVKVMTEAHSGKIEVKSEPGKGSRFDIYLPLKLAGHEQ